MTILVTILKLMIKAFSPLLCAIFLEVSLGLVDLHLAKWYSHLESSDPQIEEAAHPAEELNQDPEQSKSVPMGSDVRRSAGATDHRKIQYDYRSSIPFWSIQMKSPPICKCRRIVKINLPIHFDLVGSCIENGWHPSYEHTFGQKR